MAFGGAVKLTGESEYKKALSQITDNLKLMSSEMKIVTSTYGKNDTSVEGLTAKNKALNNQIEEQRSKVDILKKALEEAKTETGESSDTTKKWQNELNEATAKLVGMQKEVENNEKTMQTASQTTEENSKSIKKFGTESEDTGKKALSLGDIIKANLISDVIKSGIKALASGISSVTSSMTGAISAGAAYADNILTLSTQTGVSTETLQKYNAVAELVDVSTETMTASMAKNIKSMASGNDAYKQLGIAVKDSNGNLRDSEEVYWESIDALGKIDDQTQRDALAMEIFGKSAQDLNPLIQQGSEGIRNLGDEAERMGAVLNEDGLKALGELDDEMQRFKTTTASTGNILASAFAPAVSSLIGDVNDLGASFNYLISSALSGDEGGIEEASQLISDNISNMINNMAEQLPQILDIVQNLIMTISNVVVENLPAIMQGGITIITSLINGISLAIPQLLPPMIQAIMTIAQGLISNLPTILQARNASYCFSCSRNSNSFT